MSRNTSNDKNKKDKDLGNRLRGTKNIFQSSVSNFKSDDIDPNLLMRKRSERQASQGVKLLVNRERGISPDMPVDNISNNPNSSVALNVNKNLGNFQTEKNVSSSGSNSNVNNINITSSQSGSIGNIQQQQQSNTRDMNINANLNSSNIHTQSGNYSQSTYQGQGSMGNINNTMNTNYTNNTNTNTNANHNINISSNSIPSSYPQHLQQHKSQIFSRQFKEDKDKILNRLIFEKILQEKLKREGLEIRSISEISNFINIGLETYLKNVLEKLISTSRIRNVNLNLYSKQSERNPVFKIHTFNLDRQVAGNINMSTNPVNNPNPLIDIALNPYKDFSIAFTKNMKNTMNMLEQYEELNLKKLRQERVSLYKSKLEEISALKEREKEEKTKDDKSTAMSKQSAQKPRVRKRDSMLKNVRNTLAKSQKRDEMARHKKETQNTLETFLDNKPKTSLMMNPRFDTEMVSNKAESHNLETYTKFSEISKSEAPGTIGINTEGSNDINMTVFKYYTPSQNIKIAQSSNIRRRITLKDLIHFLEGERKTPLQNLILHRAVIKLNQSSH
jgi:hypothetical protein